MFGLGFKFPQLAAGGGPSLSTQIRELFANGEQGGMWDFTNPKGLYQDANGTTPVTALGQPVGLVLDRRFGLARGEEVAAPLDFTDGWSGNVGAVTITGPKTFTATASGSVRSVPTRLLTVGKVYEVNVRASRTGEGSSLALHNNEGGPLDVLAIVNGADAILDARVIFTAVSEGVSFRSGGAGDVVVDTFSIRELPGNHLSQATTAARPTYTEDGAFHDGVDDFLAAANAGDWIFLHDGSGGTLMLTANYSDDATGSQLTGTGAGTASLAGIRVGKQSLSLNRMWIGVGSGEDAVGNNSGTGGAPPGELYALGVEFDTGQLRGWMDGVAFGTTDASSFIPTDDPPYRPLTTAFGVNAPTTAIRRIFTISRILSDPERASVNAWLMEGVE